MFNIRAKKVMIFSIILTILFMLYQLSSNEPSNENARGIHVLNNQAGKDFKEVKNDDTETVVGLGLGLNSQINNIKVESPFLNENSKKLKSGQFHGAKKKIKPLFKGEKIVHLDLKGAPPKVSYFTEWFPLLKNLGATGLLLEYEDMFPYTEAYIPATNAYTKKEINVILKEAAKNNLTVIPLIQTFGHLEFVLKLKENQHLREVMSYPQVICPSRNGTSELLTMMIDDVVSMHPSSRYLHIGCDEVYNLGECSQCLDTMLKRNWTKQQLFLSHVAMVARYIKEKYPQLQVLTWDDEFRKFSVQDLKDFNIGELVEPVVWKYTPSVDIDLTDDIWDKYSAVFGSVWIASAFKGATGPDQFTTDINYHLENHKSWMRLVNAHAKQINFKGIFLTGWQRYDHFAVLCELLPVGLPSLAVNLAYLSQANIELERVPQVVTDLLRCGPGLLDAKMGARCLFPGSEVYEKAHQLSALLDQIREMMETSEARGWLSEYNMRTTFSSPAHVEGATSELNRYKMELQYLRQDMSRALKEIFDDYTVKEWIFTFMEQPQKELQTFWEAKERLLARSTWPRRPLPLDEL